MPPTMLRPGAGSVAGSGRGCDEQAPEQRDCLSIVDAADWWLAQFAAGHQTGLLLAFSTGGVRASILLHDRLDPLHD
jgi:hypothetical protein